jgi:hypothetical protein
MTVLYEVEHVTTYRHANAVTFGPHRAMFLLRPAASGRLVSWVRKDQSYLQSSLDQRLPFQRCIGDGIDEPGKDLTFTFGFRAIHFGVKEVEEFPLEARAEVVPVQYTPDEWIDLVVYMRPHAEDLNADVAAWT